MKKFLVTVSLRPDQRPGRPQDRLAGRCPLTDNFCTDITAPEHTMLIEAHGSGQVRKIMAARGYMRIVRIEQVKEDGP